MPTPESIKDFQESLLKVVEALSKFDAELQTAGGATVGYKAKIEEAKKAEIAYKDALVLLNKELGLSGKITKDTADKVAAAKSAYDTERKAIEQVNAAFKKNEEEITKTSRSLGDLTSKFKQHGMAIASFLGASTFGFAAARDGLLKYNEAMFAFSRIQQVAGTGIKDIGMAFDKMSKYTTFSKQESAEFFTMFANGYKGVKPTATAIADFAVNLQRSFGPNVEAAKKAAQDFLGIQNQFPAMFEKINNTMKMAQNPLTDPNALKQSRASLMATGMAMGMGADQMNSIAMATRKTTRDQDKLTQASKAYYDVSKESKDVMLAAAQTLEKQFIGGARAAADVLGAIKQWPAAILTATAAMKVFSMSSAGASMGGLGGGGWGGLLSGWGPKTTGRGSTMGMGKLVGRFAGPLAALSLGSDLLGGYGQARGEGQGVGEAVGSSVHGAASSFASMGMLGASIGSVVPGVGTLAGAGIGLGIAGLVNLFSKRKEESKATQVVEEQIDDALVKQQNSMLAAMANMEAMNKIGENLLSNTRSIMETYKQMQISSAGAYAGLAPSIELGIKIKEDGIKQMSVQVHKWVDVISQDMGDGISQALAGIDLTKDAGAGIQKMAAYVKQITEKSTASDEELVNLNKQSEQLSQQLELAKARKANDAEIQQIQAKQKENNTAIANTDNKRVAYGGVLTEMLKMQNAQMGLMKEKAELAVNAVNAQFDAQTEYNSAIERRLGLERELMEQANFGMGASIQAMQRQVDLAYQVMNVEKQRMAANDAAIKQKVGEANAQALINARTAGERQEILDRAGVEKGVQMEVNQLLTKRVNAMSTMMEQQKKIYELTKSMREGYLDAMHEMAVGAGEFEKIIGTQEQGTSQILSFIDQVTKGAGNTMKMGGMQSAAMTQSGVGVNYAGMMTTGGAVFESGTSAEEKNKRIYGYKESVEAAKKQQMGANVGTGLAAPGQGQDALRDGAMAGTHKGIVDGLKEVFGANGGDIFRGLNPGARNMTGNERLYPGQSTNISMQIAAAGRGGIAGNTGNLTTAPGPMPSMGGLTTAASGSNVAYGRGHIAMSAAGVVSPMQQSAELEYANTRLQEAGDNLKTTYDKHIADKKQLAEREQQKKDADAKLAEALAEQEKVIGPYNKNSNFTELQSTLGQKLSTRIATGFDVMGTRIAGTGRALKNYFTPGETVQGGDAVGEYEIDKEERLREEHNTKVRIAIEAKVAADKRLAAQKDVVSKSEYQFNAADSGFTDVAQEVQTIAEHDYRRHAAARLITEKQQKQEALMATAQDLRNQYGDNDKDAAKKMARDMLIGGNTWMLTGEKRQASFDVLRAAQKMKKATAGAQQGAVLETAVNGKSAAESQKLEASGADQAAYQAARNSGTATMQYGEASGSAGGGVARVEIYLGPELAAQIKESTGVTVDIVSKSGR